MWTSMKTVPVLTRSGRAAFSIPVKPPHLPSTFFQRHHQVGPLANASNPRRRSLFTRRTTSFWSQSYPPNASSTSPQIPYAPPSPSSNPSSAGSSGGAGPSGGGASAPEDGQKRERKQKYLDSLMDRAGELNLRCSVLDAEGNWTAQEGRFKKTELCKEYDLDPRDLRKLDSMTPNLVPLILTRRTCILISMLHIRALIKPDRVIIFETPGTVESEVQKRFKWHLERNIKVGLRVERSVFRPTEEDDEDVGLEYEHRALESILVATANALEEEMAFTRSLVTQLLADLEDDINRDNLKRLLHYSRRMVGFQSRARYAKRAVEEVLDNDEDLSSMYLTSTAIGRPRALHDHVQLELLLESFTKQVEEIVSEIDTTVANMQSTQEIAELMLDSGRNALLALDIKISIATLAIGSAALVAGFFGMNLTSHFEASPYGFYIAAAAGTTFATIIFLFGIRTLRRVRRVALSDSSYSRNRLAWEDGISHLPTVDPLTGVTRQPSADHLSRLQQAKKMLFFGWLGARRQSNEEKAAMLAKMHELKQLKQVRGMRSGSAFGGRGEGCAEPVWINPKADLARMRDAWVASNQLSGSGSGEKKDEGWCAPGTGGDLAVGWEAGPWKWGRGKARWAKE